MKYVIHASVGTAKVSEYYNPNKTKEYLIE